MLRRVLSTALLCLSVAHLEAARARPQSAPSELDAQLKQGWALLGQRDFRNASAVASALLAKYPKNPDVQALAVELNIENNGALAGLEMYERLVVRDRGDDRVLIRRVARGFLREAARDKTRATARSEALDALLSDGDAEAAALIDSDASLTLAPDTPLIAARGDDRAIKLLIDALDNPLSNRRLAIGGLARTRSPRAVKPLAALLTDMDIGVRMAAIEALGKLGLPEGVPVLKPLLNDPIFDVHFAAAAALMELHDASGLPWLRELQKSEHPGVRLAAANALKSDPDPAWVDQVRRLARDPDVDIRRRAAELLAAHDPAEAREILEAVRNDENPAQREAAGDALVRVAIDPAVLRSYLRSADALQRVRAAARLLEIFR